MCAKKLNSCRKVFDSSNSEEECGAGNRSQGGKHKLKKEKHKLKTKRPSLRHAAEGESDDNEQVTPDLRTCVADHLSSLLDRDLEEVDGPSHSSNDQPNAQSDFRLFSGSLPGGIVTTSVPAPSKRRRHQSDSTDSEEEERRVRSVAVSGDFILSQSAIPAARPPPAPSDPMTSPDPAEPRQKHHKKKKHKLKKNKH